MPRGSFLAFVWMSPKTLSMALTAVDHTSSTFRSCTECKPRAWLVCTLVKLRFPAFRNLTQDDDDLTCVLSEQSRLVRQHTTLDMATST